MGLNPAQIVAAVDRFWFRPESARTYAIFRVAFAVASIVNWMDMFPHRYRLFAPNGLMDQATVLKITQDEPYFSAFYHISSAQGVDVIFAVALLGMIGLLVGCCARISALICFLWSLSYTHYAFLGMHGWDALLRIYSFILLISPLGLRHFSVDKRWIPKLFSWVSYPSLVSHHGLLLLKVQLVVMYWYTVWIKLPNIYWRNGELLGYFAMSMYARFHSSLLIQWPLLCNVLTFGTLLIEFLVPILLWKREWRFWGFVLGYGLHIGIIITSNLLPFSLTVMILYLPFLEKGDLQRWKNRYLPWRKASVETD